jgi:phage tail protein X
MQVRSRKGDTLDALIYRYLGSSTGYVEQAFELNRHIAVFDAELPAGTVITLPDMSDNAGTASNTVSLWE